MVWKRIWFSITINVVQYQTIQYFQLSQSASGGGGGSRSYPIVAYQIMLQMVVPGGGGAGININCAGHTMENFILQVILHQ